MDTLGHVLALTVTPADVQDRAQVGQLAQAIQEAVDKPVHVAFVDQGYSGEQPAAAAAQQGIQLEVVKHHEAKHGFVLLPRRWVMERSFAWAARFRRLARDYERLPATLAAYHWLAFATLMLAALFRKFSTSSNTLLNLEPDFLVGTDYKSFETGSNEYILDSVTLMMGGYTPGAQNFTVAIYSDSNGTAGLSTWRAERKQRPRTGRQIRLYGNGGYSKCFHCVLDSEQL